MTKMGLRLALSLGLGTILVSFAPESLAKDPPPFPNFEAKRVTPPKAGTRKRINIQIEPKPEPQKAAPQAEAESTPEGDNLGSYPWFWEKVPVAGAEPVPGRLQLAMAAIAGATQAPQAPRLQLMHDIARTHGADILRHSIGTDISPALVLAVIAVESSGKADAESPAGAQGLMQLMPATAARFGVEDSLVPAQNISGGIKYLNWLTNEFGGDAVLVLAGYNAGEGSVRKHNGVPPFAETRNYVPKVLAAFQVAKGLCVTPPELISDGCAFVGLK